MIILRYFQFLHKNIHCGYLLDVPRCLADDSHEMPSLIFSEKII